MKRCAVLLVVAVLLVISLGCALFAERGTGNGGTSASAGDVEVSERFPSTQPPVASESDPTLIAYGYEVKDAGDGWNVGTLRLAFENTSDVMVPSDPPPRSKGYYNVNNAFVETQEGKTYPVKVIADYGLLSYSEGEIDLRAMPGIPPGFRLEGGFSSIGGTYVMWGRLIVEFKFAQVAHPTVIKFPTRPDWTINLAEAAKSDLEMPTDLPVSSFKSINALNGTVLLNEPGKLLVTLGRCVLVRDKGYLTYTAVNRDQLDEISANVQFPAYASLRKGQIDYERTTTIEIKVGPGQTEENRLYVFSLSDATTHLILYQPDGEYDVYTTGDCVPETQ